MYEHSLVSLLRLVYFSLLILKKNRRRSSIIDFQEIYLHIQIYRAKHVSITSNSLLPIFEKRGQLDTTQAVTKGPPILQLISGMVGTYLLTGKDLTFLNLQYNLKIFYHQLKSVLTIFCHIMHNKLRSHY